MAILQNIFFDNFNLTSLPDIVFTRVEYYRRPKLEVQRYKLARRDGSKLVNAEFGALEINLIGNIQSNLGRRGFEAARDQLMYRTLGQEKVLGAYINGRYRNFVCTVDDVMLSEVNGGYAAFNIKFTCSKPFGEDAETTTVLSNAGNTGTSSTKTFVAAISGTYKAEPILTCIVQAVTGGTSKYIRLGNPATGKYIKVTRTWANGDTLVIDVANKTCKVNGTDVDYAGVFPTWEVGHDQLHYEDSLTSRTVALSVTYKKRYV